MVEVSSRGLGLGGRGGIGDDEHHVLHGGSCLRRCADEHTTNGDRPDPTAARSNPPAGTRDGPTIRCDPCPRCRARTGPRARHGGRGGAVEPPAPAAHLASQTDSVYPSVGSPGLDVLDYGLSLRWRPAIRTLVGVARLRLVPARDGAFRLDLARPLRVTRLAVRDRLDRPAPAVVEHAPRPAPRVVGTGGLVAGTTYAVRDRLPRAARDPRTAPSSRRRHEPGSAGTPPAPARRGRCRSRTARSRGTRSTTTRRTRRPTGRGSTCRGAGSASPTAGSAARRVAHGRTITQFTNRDPMASYLMTVAIGPYGARRRPGRTGCR